MFSRIPAWCIVAAALCGCWVGDCPAQLRFEKTTITVPSTGQAVLVAEFSFEVGPVGQVVISKVEADCGCATGSLDKKIYEPGEKGKIKLEFRVGEAEGPQEKRLAITASDQTPPHILTLLTQLPRLFDFSARTIYWDHASALSEKVIAFQVAEGQASMAVVRADSDQPAVSVSVKEIVPGRKFEFHLKPTATDQVLVARIHITTTDVNKTERAFYCFGMVKPPVPE